MAFMPFFSVLIAFIVGIYALAFVPGLEGADSDPVLLGEEKTLERISHMLKTGKPLRN